MRSFLRRGTSHKTIGLREVFEFACLSSLATKVRDAQFAEFDPGDLARLAKMMSDS